MGYGNSFKASQARAQIVFDALRADDVRFDQNGEQFLIVSHEEGSELKLKHAFILTDPEDPMWVWVMSEHMHFYVLAMDAVLFSVTERS